MEPKRDAGPADARAILARLAGGGTLTVAQARDAVGAILRGAWAEGEVGAILGAMAARGETTDEVVGGALAMRDAARPFGGRVPGAVDTCGTGGDGLETFNISTAAALVVSACGVPVAKHGNRRAGGVSGSADVLTALGVDVETPPDRVAEGLRDLHFGFFFTPIWHPGARALAPLRRRLGFRTLFNLLGPLSNPAGAEFQLIGSGRTDTADALARALARLGATATVVTGRDGLDEVTLAGETRAICVREGRAEERTWTPDDFGLPRADPDAWRVGSADESAAVVLGVLEGRPGPARDVVLANASAALWTTGKVATLREGVDLGMSVIASGSARQRLEGLIALGGAAPTFAGAPCSAWLLD